MRFRTGFVSNSSSSSFVAIGYKVKKNEEMYTKIRKELFDKLSKSNNSWRPKTIDDIEDYEVREVLEEKYPDITFISHWECSMLSKECKPGEEIVAIVLGDSGSDDCLESMALTLDEVKKTVKQIPKHFEVIDKEPKIYIGTRSC